jgi:hypothetical protein
MTGYLNKGRNGNVHSRRKVLLNDVVGFVEYKCVLSLLKIRVDAFKYLG